MSNRKSRTVAPAPAVMPDFEACDFARIKGQESVKRAITVALAGQHPVVLIGPSGCGKSMVTAAAKAIDPAFKAVEVTLWSRPTEQKRRQEIEHLAKLARAGDLHIEVPNVPFRDLFSRQYGTSSQIVRQHVERARNWGRTDTTLSDGCLLLMKQAYDELGLAPAAAIRAIAVARTIANLEESEAIQEQHLAEAVQYRLFDRKF